MTSSITLDDTSPSRETVLDVAARLDPARREELAAMAARLLDEQDEATP